MLCRNYAPGGSGDCPYRLACQYIHPSDGLLYKLCQADTPEFKVLKGQHQEEIQKLYVQRMMSPPSQQFQLEAAINWKVRQFNTGHPNGDDYYDLHGMTTMGMVSYVHSPLVYSGHCQADEKDRTDQGMAGSRKRNPLSKWIPSDEDPLDE